MKTVRIYTNEQIVPFINTERTQIFSMFAEKYMPEHFIIDHVLSSSAWDKEYFIAVQALNFTPEEIETKRVVLIHGLGYARFEELEKGDLFNILTNEGFDKNKKDVVGKWRVVKPPKLIPGLKSAEVYGVDCDLVA